jgi:hypothetical protein
MNKSRATEKRQEPLYLQIEELGSLAGKELHPEVIAAVLHLLADNIEARGERQEDLDPCETADWLRSEAETALEWS